MAEATKIDAMFATKRSLVSEDIDTGSNRGHASDIERKELSIQTSLEIMAERENNGNHVVCIDQWVSSLERILEDVPRYMCQPGHPGRVGKIPENLREVDIKAYEPYFLSIGPYHHGKALLQKMEPRKHLFLRFFLQQKPELTLKDYLKEIKSLEIAARSFYSEVEMNSEKFVRMLLLDSLFIISVFCGLPESQESMDQTNRTTGSRVENEDMNESVSQINQATRSEEHNENMPVMARVSESSDSTSEAPMLPRWFWTLFMHDIFLLENQIPFFVLQKIYALAYGGSEAELLDIVKDKVGSMLLSYTKLDSEMVISSNEEVHHILHLCHMFFHPTLQEVSNSQLPGSNQMFRLGSAVQLHEAGVNFEARPDSVQHCLLDVSFSSSGKMVMSSLQVDDNTMSLLRNLIALEQMKYPSLGLNVSAYAVLLLHLITVPEDVKLLRREGIIQHHLASDKEMVYLVNRLSVGLAFDYVEDEYSLKHTFRELKIYSERRVPRWTAWLEHRYFNNPWTMISLLAATFLLLLSVVETYYTVYSYYFPYPHGHS